MSRSKPLVRILTTDTGINECSICLKAFGGMGSTGALTACGHCLHVHCFYEWEDHHHRSSSDELKCPICRIEVDDFIPLFVDFRTHTSTSSTEAIGTVKPKEMTVKSSTVMKGVSMLADAHPRIIKPMEDTSLLLFADSMMLCVDEEAVEPAASVEDVSILDDMRNSKPCCSCGYCDDLPEDQPKHFTVEGACTSFLNGTYEEDRTLKGHPFYRHIGEVDVVVVIRMCGYQQLALDHTNDYDDDFSLHFDSSNKMKYWYITALFEKGVNVNYYYVPVNKSCLLVPPSTGWKYVGVPTTIADAQPPIIHQLIE